MREKFSNTDIIIGAGSIVDVTTASQYVNAGADFVVSPSLHPEIVRFCNRRNIMYIPGCGTLTEILRAYEEGTLIAKLFPASTMVGTEFLKTIRAPCPWIDAIPTGGVEPTQESLEGWMKAGAIGVGMGSRLLTRELIKRKRWEEVTAKVKSTLELINRLKKSMSV
ncbi:MAG TPA: bifunctional 4-hydroxy-2-oxoglutarate aldolase/2-dehydro-3-deoxy-phosphogluconate aldolase [Candidatus Omnitrophica bacterium]|nr:bifunctional 4-hydroxy-2-oxoglutarate aldolase/2-dehydro-3-deoxy-phosphogluconate aldolase [Candidatus Omnitrophota bacterium]